MCPADEPAARLGIATVCPSGTLKDKLAAAAAAGFDGVEIFEPDLVASPLSPTEVRRRCADSGVSVDLYQPFRDLDALAADRFAANLRRAEHKFAVMQQLGTDTVLVCSAVAPGAVADLDLGTHINTCERSWEVVRRGDHPPLGLCLDSFHLLSRGFEPAGILAIPAEKLFFLQLADAPRLRIDVLQWSRDHRLRRATCTRRANRPIRPARLHAPPRCAPRSCRATAGRRRPISPALPHRTAHRCSSAGPTPPVAGSPTSSAPAQPTAV